MASKPRLVLLAQDPDPGHDPRSAEVREEALRLAFHQGDPDAFAELARPHLDTLYTLCLRMLGDPVLAEDLAQDALARVLQQASRYDPARPFRPWLLKVGLNLCRDRLRAVWWRRVLSLGAIAEGTLFDPGPDPEAVRSASERDRLVRNALATLPPKYREAVSLFHLEEMTYAEMTEITGVAVPALKQRVRRGCILLRNAVTRMYPELLPGRN